MNSKYVEYRICWKDRINGLSSSGKWMPIKKEHGAKYFSDLIDDLNYGCLNVSDSVRRTIEHWILNRVKYV